LYLQALKPHARTYLLRLTRESKLSITSQPPGEIGAPLARRIGWAVLILITLYFCYFSHLDVIGFVGPDEPRYAWIARDMAETGDWVTPRLYGKPWFEKPPFLYWESALFFKLFGSSAPEVAARLPSAISALLATLALAWLAWRIYGDECARWLLLLLPTSVGMIGFSHAAATDMPFAGMLTIAMVCAAVVLGLVSKNENTPILPRTPWLALLLFGFFLGLAVLAKGPAAIILSGGAVFFWAIFTKRWRDALRLLHPAALASFCITALPWYILCARRNPDFFRIFIIEHNFKRYLTPEFQHVQPFWFYAPVLLVAFLPWSFLIVASTVAGIRQWWRNKETSSLTCLVFCWAMFCLVFFTISKSKLPGYVLPAVPAIAFLGARAIAGVTWFSRRVAGYCLIGGSVVYFVTTIYFRFGFPRAHSYPNTSWELSVLLILVFGMYALATFFAGYSLSFNSDSRPNFAFRTTSVLMLVLLMELVPFEFAKTQLDVLSGKWLANILKPGDVEVDRLRTFGLRRDDHYALNFYLHHSVPAWTDDPLRDGYVLARSANCTTLQSHDHCSEIWGSRNMPSGWALLRITPDHSLERPGGGRQPRQEE
jgi:4-amino-4-deoxy-L-arabinose transferase-like glycosyltransferase